MVELTAAVQRGDGVVFESDGPDNSRQGGRVYGVFRQGQPLDEPVADGLVELSFGRGAIDLDTTAAGTESMEDRRSAVDPAAAEDLYGRAIAASRAAGFDGRGQRRRAFAHFRPRRFRRRLRIESPHVLAEARKHPLTAEVLAEQLGRLGGTAYRLRGLEPASKAGPWRR